MFEKGWRAGAASVTPSPAPAAPPEPIGKRAIFCGDCEAESRTGTGVHGKAGEECWCPCHKRGDGVAVPMPGYFTAGLAGSRPAPPAPSPADPRADGDAEKLIEETRRTLADVATVNGPHAETDRAILRDFASRVREPLEQERDRAMKGMVRNVIDLAEAEAVFCKKHKPLLRCMIDRPDLRTPNCPACREDLLAREAERKLAEVTRANELLRAALDRAEEREKVQAGYCEEHKAAVAAAVRDTWDKAEDIAQRAVSDRLAGPDFVEGRSTTDYIVSALHAARA
jgi:hypothetical protein